MRHEPAVEPPCAEESTTSEDLFPTREDNMAAVLRQPMNLMRT